MNLSAITIALISLTLVSGSRFHGREPPKYPFPEASEACKKLCKVDSGIDADPSDCLTECAVHSDLKTHSLEEGLHEFTYDESFNENQEGGNPMDKTHDEGAPREVWDCHPWPGYGPDHNPEFKDLDTNGDGVIDGSEALDFSTKACIPDEMQMQMFNEMDLNRDKLIDKREFYGAGEDTVSEKAMDDALEGVSQGDDEYNSVQNPPIDEFDKNKDGALDKKEYEDDIMHEVERRTEHADVPGPTKDELKPEIDEAFEKTDADHDGKISGEEYTKKLDKPEGGGEEIREAMEAKEDKEELDELPRAGEETPGAHAKTLISHRSEVHRSHRMHHKRGHRNNLKMAETMVANARLQHRLRQAMLDQHHRRLRRAVLLRRQALLRQAKLRR